MGVTPRAAGTRIGYADIPERVRAWVEQTLGAPVVGTAEQIGGMSPGCATRLRCADGTRAFVKAVGRELNVLTPDLFRHEATVLEHIGTDPLWAGLLASYDEPDGWVALLMEDVEGRHPDLRDPAEAEVVLEATDRFVDRLAGLGKGLQVATLEGQLARYTQMWPHLEGVATLPGWALKAVPRMQAALGGLREAADGEHLCNFDVRNDNLLLRPDGSVVFVDWGMSRVGAAWLDPLVLRLEWAELPLFDALVTTSPALAALNEEQVTGFLYALGAWLAYRAAVDDTGPPGLHAFRTLESARFLEGARRRLGA
jgi:hypothetical protein